MIVSHNNTASHYVTLNLHDKCAKSILLLLSYCYHRLCHHFSGSNRSLDAIIGSEITIRPASAFKVF